MPEMIPLVDKNDNIIGYEEKVKAHEDGGKLHRSFSIFIFNSKGQMLLQLRSVKKYHFGGLWSNACCSHPRKGEELTDAVHRKLKQEFGFDTNLKELFSFIYKVTDPNSGLTEYEFDHVFVGTFDGEPKPNPEEIDAFKWMPIDELKVDVAKNPDKYSLWFRIALDRVLESQRSK
ncbi:MAG: isopentenyl-diphosphate Delta-isomerase [Candidatus Aenigmatarchaeota archaeon]|nr:isopentenyl-diphosphate Delta-isomerase [Candidatus Aenigmarchaeota archaeon]